ncbi:branched-chain amino acid transaminase [Streptomyces sp. NBC_00441]|uniref:branched-chain amino acid transaminase n=1 Tax=Streptomyces sp. NBC_00441 TaxID=2975742 RepID=UPI002E2E08F0|nr:branched-chain amino acid transaminase [Streptomyces sp. NBC_00441]
MRVERTAAVWQDGRLLPWDEAQVHVLNQTLQYGWGVYEGIRVYETADGPSAFRLDAHLRRLFRSAAMYAMEIPYSTEQLTDAVRDLVAANDLAACYVRPLVHAESGTMGIDPGTGPLRVAIAVWPWEKFLGTDAAVQGIRACVSSWRRVPGNALPTGGKACGLYLNSMLARSEAARHGYDEAILLNSQGTVADACVENVFCVTGDRIVTPPLSDGPLPGITRDSVMTLAADCGIEVQERSLTRADLYTADELFLTGTAAEVVPVVELDGRRIGDGLPGPVTVSLAQSFRRVVVGEDPRYGAWLTPMNQPVPGEVAS